MLTPTPNAARVASAAIESSAVDSATNAQDVDPNEVLDDAALASLVAQPVNGKRPFLRDNWLYRTVGYKYGWLTIYENWVYLLLLAFLAGGFYWHFKKK